MPPLSAPLLRMRSQLLTTLSGRGDGRADWVDLVEEGDDAGYFGPGSAAWAVHGGMPTLVAGIRALLLQALHPGALAGVHDWSRYREDPLGRLTGTIRWLVLVTFGSTSTARRESERVQRIHERVRGVYRDGRGEERAYAATDDDLLSWVHVAFMDAFLRCHETWGRPIPGGADGYVQEWATAGRLVGVPRPPVTEEELRATLERYRTEGVLRRDERVDEVVRFIRRPPLPRSMLPVYRVFFAGAVATLPPELRRLLGLRRAVWPAVTATRVLLAGTRWLLGPRSASEEAALARVSRLSETPLRD